MPSFEFVKFLRERLFMSYNDFLQKSEPKRKEIYKAYLIMLERGKL